MNIYKELILIKDNKTKEFKDKTAEISYFKYIKNQVEVTYLSINKTYTYNSSNVRVFKEPKTINVDEKIVFISGFPIATSSLLLDFGDYVKIIDSNERAEAYHKSKVSYENSCLNLKQPKAVFDYFKGLSPYVSVMEDGKTRLLDQYKKISKIREQSVLSTYLSGNPIKKNRNDDINIFPFGFNLSQKKAVKTALENSISIIEGPPGTGKTQTILNIIANVVAKGKTVGIVAGNNSATANVQEKLEKNGYDFITALLGNSTNKTNFFEHGQSAIPDLMDWGIQVGEITELSEKLVSISKNLDELLEKQKKIAILKEELSKLEVEQTYFENNFKELYNDILKFSFYTKWSSNSILDFLTFFERTVLSGENNKLKVKAVLFIKYGIYKFKYIDENQSYVVTSLKRDYYKNSILEVKQRIYSLEKKLENKSYKKLIQQYQDISEKLFKAQLHRKYAKVARENYTVKSFRYKFQKFIQDYPVILSTTHSIMNNISENYLFDYIIIDEASQVDLVTASLALACCKNVVIVGDVKQLPQIVGTDLENKSNEIFYSSNLKEAYNYNRNSIIASLMELYKDDLPKTLLSEHYRCHPKIIGFCNEKFYNNQLVIMTEENTNDVPLKIYKTAPGNHARKGKLENEKGWCNLRQIEVIRDEILNGNTDKYQDNTQIGIICPYRMQVTETVKYIGKSQIEVDTVHKFQGREKNTIIFTTVVNDINSFVDDANLINVAVSRAIKELIVVTSNKVFRQHGTNIGDLIRYIEYNSLEEAVIESQKISVFDLLYSEYSEKLLKIMTSIEHVSVYKSENLMYNVIDEVLKLSEFTSFKCVIHVPLNSIVKDLDILTIDEKKFAQNPWTHVDFLIFNRLDKEPVLVVEVDGYEYHINNEIQRARDAMKDKILDQINLPILRVVTNESGERERLIEALNRVVEESGEME